MDTYQQNNDTTTVDIICGFLGSGKTTLIQKLLSEAFMNEKVVVIENEFGEIGLDGKIIGEKSSYVYEINSGCICCTVTGDFVTAISKITKEMIPDRIIIEPSGVANLSDVLRIFNDEKLKGIVNLNMVLTILDAVNYDIYSKNFTGFFDDQITNGRIMILSKTQAVTNDNINNIIKDIGQKNKKALIIKAPWDDINGSDIVAIVKNADTTSVSDKKGCKCGKENHNCCGHHGGHHQNQHIFDSLSVKVSGEYSKAQLTETLNSLKHDTTYGKILRAKGVLKDSEYGWYQFDYVSGVLDTRPFHKQESGSLCMIGQQLDKEKLSLFFRDVIS